MKYNTTVEKHENPSEIEIINDENKNEILNDLKNKNAFDKDESWSRGSKVDSGFQILINSHPTSMRSIC